MVAHRGKYYHVHIYVAPELFKTKSLRGPKTKTHAKLDVYLNILNGGFVVLKVIL